MWVIVEADIQSGGHRRYFVGLGLTGGTERSTLSIVEQRVGHMVAHPYAGRGHSPSAGLQPVTYTLRHLARRPPGTPDASDAAAVCEPSSSVPPWVVINGGTEAPGGELCVQVVGTLKERGLRPVVVTLSRSPRPPRHDGILVRKEDALGAMAMLFETQRLKVASTIDVIPELLNEWKACRASVASRPRDGEAVCGSGHDNLVLCTALPLWYALQLRREP